MNFSVTVKDISVVIPTFNYANTVNIAIRSALENGAGEVLVVDDASTDNTVKAISREFSDRRLRVLVNNKNLGLWRNHGVAVDNASKDWIKILQADDALLPGGLKRMAESVSPETSIVWNNPIFVESNSGRCYELYKLSKVIRTTGEDTWRKIAENGNFLGTPSHSMLRRDVVERGKQYYRNDVSADVLMGFIAITSGELVCLPSGNISHGVHPRQDTHNQGFSGFTNRLLNTLTIIKKEIYFTNSEYLNSYIAHEIIRWLRAYAGAFRRGKADFSYFRTLAEMLRLIDWGALPMHLGTLMDLRSANFRNGPWLIQ